jgi:hypothetical protein
VGETGEKDNTIYWATTDYFEAYNIGWSFWPWKKMDTRNTPCSINLPDHWQEISAYSRGGKIKVPKDTAKKAFDQLLDNIKLENCVYYPDVVNALLRRVPGRVEAENYGHEGPGKSYWLRDAGQKSQHYRKSEPVPVEVIDTPIERGPTGRPSNWRNQSGRLTRSTASKRGISRPASGESGDTPAVFEVILMAPATSCAQRARVG